MGTGIVSYRMLALIGEGGFGKVYRARLRADDGFEKDVAVKILTDDKPPRALLQRFRDEARILGLLRDRAIVGVQPPVRIAGLWAVVMDFVDGNSLGAALERGPLPPTVALEVVGEVARALHNAFQMEGPDGRPLELLHRDIKPDNVQVTPAGEVKLLDFGIARASFAEREAKTRQGFAGTPGYIAPERTQGTEVAAGDVYSLGVMLHELVLGARPKMPATVVVKDGTPIVTEEDLDVPEPSSLQPDVRKVVELAAWMRSYDYAQRPTARQVEDLCRGLRQGMQGPWLRQWAETSLVARAPLPPDDRVGQSYVEQDEGGPTALRNGTGPLPPSPVAPPAPTPALAIPIDAVPAGAATTELPRPAAGRVPTWALAAVGLGLLLVIGVGAVVTGVTAAAVWLGPSTPVAVGGTPPGIPPAEVDPVPDQSPDPGPAPAPDRPRPAPQPEAPEPAQPVPAKPPPPETPKPEPPRPEPPAPPPVPTAPSPGRVIVLPGTGTGTGAPAPAPAAPVRRTGRVVLNTIPTGATALLNGERLERSGGAYVLPLGNHLLEIQSSVTGEKMKLPVTVTEGRDVLVCYNFDTNSRCN